MKKLILLLVALLPAFIYAQQTEWSDAEKEVLQKFSLNQNDHRGIVFSNSSDNCDDTAENAEEALLMFLVPDVRKDIITICTSSIGAEFMNYPLGIHEVVQLYVEIIKTDSK